jgi:hypothetical protein
MNGFNHGKLPPAPEVLSFWCGLREWLRTAMRKSADVVMLEDVIIDKHVIDVASETLARCLPRQTTTNTKTVKHTPINPQPMLIVRY